jgi:lipid-A-disaccharide synthase-like uncharacterized protein
MSKHMLQIGEKKINNENCLCKHFPFAFWDTVISLGLLFLFYYIDMMVTHDKVNFVTL